MASDNFSFLFNNSQHTYKKSKWIFTSMPFESGGTVPCKKLSLAKDVCIGDTTIELSDGIDRILLQGVPT